MILVRSKTREIDEKQTRLQCSFEASERSDNVQVFAAPIERRRAEAKGHDSRIFESCASCDRPSVRVAALVWCRFFPLLLERLREKSH